MRWVEDVCRRGDPDEIDEAKGKLWEWYYVLEEISKDEYEQMHALLSGADRSCCVDVKRGSVR